jgi:hypothetical protein
VVDPLRLLKVSSLFKLNVTNSTNISSVSSQLVANIDNFILSSQQNSLNYSNTVSLVNQVLNVLDSVSTLGDLSIDSFVSISQAFNRLLQQPASFFAGLSQADVAPR